MKALKFLFISVAILLLFWFGWTQYDYGDFPNPSIHLDQDIHFQDFPLDSTTGHIIGIQPIMTPADFTSEENYFLKLNNYLQKAEEKNWLKENSIVLFPEYIGTWLVVANQRKSIYQNERINAAMIQLIAMQPLEFLKNWLQSNAENKVNEAIFSMATEKMAEI